MIKHNIGKEPKLTEAWSKKPKNLSVASIPDKYVRFNTAVLLENQDHLLKKNLNEDFGTGVSYPTGLNQGVPHSGLGKGVLPNVAMALVRRAFPELFANVLVGVQPMSRPVGLAYAIRRIYQLPNSNEIVEAAWKEVPKFSGFTGSTANSDGYPDAGTAVETEAAEHWKLGGDPNKFEKWPEVSIITARQVIQAKTRKVGSSFSVESAQDIESMLKVDMFSEMISICKEELVQEIDRETIAHCKALCTAKIFTSDDSNSNSWNGRWSQERLSNIVSRIIGASNNIRTSTREAAGNIAVVSPDVATALQSAAPNFHKIPSAVNGSSPTPYAGTLNGNIKVYIDNNAVDPKTNEDNGEVLVAYKGEGINRCGVVYCPYITSLVLQATDPNDFSRRIGVVSRYAFADNILGAENYYRLLRFTGLGSKVGFETSEEATW